MTSFQEGFLAGMGATVVLELLAAAVILVLLCRYCPTALRKFGEREP